MPSPSASDTFLRDLSAAVAAWRVAWWMPVISVLLGASLWANGAERLLATDPETLGTNPGDGQFAVILLLVSVTELGWFGSERAIYRRVWEGTQDPAAGLLRLTRGFVFPFLRAGLMVGWPLLLVPAVLDPDRPDIARLVVYAVTVAVYVLATFIPPELVYRPQPASAAVRRGVGLLRREFRAVWIHAVAAPVVLVTIGAAASVDGIPEEAAFAIGAIGTLAALATKGAIAFRWLSLHADTVDAGTSPERAGETHA